jgi:alcohol dehydrogenase YqhD (iron-dependent ADH family)
MSQSWLTNVKHSISDLTNIPIAKGSAILLPLWTGQAESYDFGGFQIY